MKKLFLLSIFAALAIFISMGCMTSAVLEKQEYKESSYGEKINSFLLSQDAKKIVFISDKYHYILNADQRLSTLLMHRGEEGVEFAIEKGNYAITNNRATARFSATIDPEKNPELANLLGYEKFKKLSKNKNFWLSFYLTGERFLADQKVNDAALKLDNAISINIHEKESVTTVGTVAKKIVLTPIALVGDVILLGGVIVVVPIIAIGAAVH